MTRSAAAASVDTPPPWKRSLVWLFFLGPFFFLSYGYSNHLAAARQVSESLSFEWERMIPFVPWTIVPYWSIDIFYGLSFLLCRNRREVDSHGLRLLTAQLISVACFLAFPLYFSFERPQVDGFFGALFDMLMGFDKPYNQAPSLHIGLLVIIWARFAAATPVGWRWVAHVWALLIGVSVLTTYQHHFIDLPTGALVGLLCLWLWPDAGRPPLAAWPAQVAPMRRRLARHYVLAAALFGLVAAAFGGIALCLWWVTTALGLVALIYAGPGATAFQKQDGCHSLATRVLLLPYIAGAWLNSRIWTRHHPDPDRINDGVWLGRMPTAADMRAGGYAALVDLTAELPAPHGDWQYVGLAWLDLVPPAAAELNEAARHIESMRAHGPVLVCCALGFTRSACAVAAWLLATGRAGDIEEAEAILRTCRPGVVLGESHRAALAAMLADQRGVPR
jgi:protein-tyrosine phosphatase